jgi:Holliday junction resolvase RusA-like endonuclease
MSQRPLGFTLMVDPPTTTAQMKRLRVVNGKPVFFHGKRMLLQATAWSWALTQHRPHSPLLGPLSLTLDLDYPHTKQSAKIGHPIRKVTRPDVDGAAKHFIDTMQRMGFFEDDSQISELTIRKWHDANPKIRVLLQPCL